MDQLSFPSNVPPTGSGMFEVPHFDMNCFESHLESLDFSAAQGHSCQLLQMSFV